MTTPAKLRNREPFPLDPSQEGDQLPIPWAEDTSEEQPHEQSFSYNGPASHAMKIWLDYGTADHHGKDSAIVALRYILGWAYRDDGADSGTKLRRIPAWRSPIYPWMRASSVNGFKLLDLFETDATAKFGDLANALRLGVTVSFSPPHYAVLNDRKLAQQVALPGTTKEILRYVQRREEDYSEFITIDGDYFYAEGPNTGKP